MQQREFGVALPGVMALVLVMTMISLAGLERAVWQTRLTNAAVVEQQAFEAAEAALRRVQSDLPPYAGPPLSLASSASAQHWQGLLEQFGQPVAALSDYPPARVLVESIPPRYRVTALGYSRQGQKTAMVQAIIAADDSTYLWRRLR